MVISQQSTSGVIGVGRSGGVPEEPTVNVLSRPAPAPVAVLPNPASGNDEESRPATLLLLRWTLPLSELLPLL
jgi:hypothetical protein